MEKRFSCKGFIGGLVLVLIFMCGYAQPALAETTETSGTFRVMTYNVAGLPAILSEGNPSENTEQIGRLMKDYDIVAVQEDFHYHHVFLKTVNNFPYISHHKGSVPKGDGMNIFSKFPLGNTTRYRWDKLHGIFSDGSDELTPKGCSFNRVQLAPGAYVDVYNLHADAGRDAESTDARRDNFRQLARLINKYSAGNAVIVMGDTNARYLRAEDQIYKLLVEPTGLKDAWVEVVRDGDFPKPDAEKLAYVEEHAKDPDVDKDGPENEEVDKIFYRSGNGVDLEAIMFEAQDHVFIDSNGNPLSDHFPFAATFQYTTNTPESNKVYLSDMKIKTFLNGWGPVEYDRSNGEKDVRDGRAMNIEGSFFSKGLGVHADSYVEYELKGEFTKFQSYIGLDDENNGGSVIFEVFGDGKSLYKSGLIKDNTRPQYVSVDVTGVQNLGLRVYKATNGNGNDHANWAEAAVLRSEETEEGYMVNDTDPNIQYIGKFQRKAKRKYEYMDDVHQTIDHGDKYKYTFYGTGIEVLGVKDTTIGDQLVKIDGVSYGVSNAYMPDYTSMQKIFEVRDLPLGMHTIEVEMLSGGWMVLDAFKVYRPIQNFSYLSDLAWDYVTNGDGPMELDMSTGGGRKSDGRTLTINGRTFEKGLGVHSYSEVRYEINEKYSRFQSYIGIDDEVSKGNVRFRVLGDGKELYRSKEMNHKADAVFVDIDVRGVGQLMLIVDEVDGKGYDHADWADAKLIK